MEIGSVQVKEEYQGKGLFKEFLRVWEEIAKAKGRDVFIECVHSEILQEMLKRHGYEQVDENFWKLLL
jgi:predicted GNAT family N-acyltransferase